MNQTKFAVRRFKNRNGVDSWRVAGWLHGVRIRRNFKTREEAAAEKGALELRALQAASGMRSATTFLTDAQLREAEDAFRRLSGRPHGLLFYLDFAIKNQRELQSGISIGDAVEAYVAEKTKQEQRGLLSKPQLRCIKSELRIFTERFTATMVAQISSAMLVPYLERGAPSLKTYNNRRAILSTFFKFALRNDWITQDPVEKTPYHRIQHRRGSATTLSATKSAQLLAYVEEFEGGVMAPYFALCLFAGLRPCTRTGEISKLAANCVRLDTGVIHIEPEVSKVRMKRNVTIQPNLASWLRAYPLDRWPILPKNAEEMRGKIFRAFDLTHDVLRHTFISMFVGKFRSMGEAALQAGNSESIIRKHYLDLKTAEEADEFFSIQPKKTVDADKAPITTNHLPSAA